jgi:imidazolonepropionase-like amidohydrolase
LMRLLTAAVLTAVLGAPTAVTAQNLPGSKEEVARFVRLRAKSVVLENVRVIDGTGSPPKENQDIVITDGRITAVGDAGRAAPPKDATRVGLKGRTVLPGLVMLHEHMFYFSGFRVWHSQAVSYPRLYLAAGVTTVRTAGTDVPYTDLNLKLAIDEGRIAGPKMFVTGPFFNGYEGHFLGDAIVRTEQDARRAVDYWAGEGVTSFKVYAGISREALKGVIEEAHARRLKVTGHLASVSCREAADLGIDNIEHSFISCVKELGMGDGPGGSVTAPDPEKARLLIHHLVKAGVVLTSTPSAVERPISKEELELLHPTARERYLEMMLSGPPSRAALESHVRRLEREFVSAGGRLVIGSDPQDGGQIAGYADRRALELLVEAGWKPIEVIRMATLGGAQFLGVGGEVGSVAEGKAADLIVVDGNPAADIKDVEKVELVFKDGVAYDPKLLRDSVRGLVGWH